VTPERRTALERNTNAKALRYVFKQFPNSAADDTAAFFREMLNEIDRLDGQYRKLAACVQQVGPWPQVYDTFFCNNCGSVLPDHEPDCPGVAIATQLQQPDPTE
jgi:hypothetical protein